MFFKISYAISFMVKQESVQVIELKMDPAGSEAISLGYWHLYSFIKAGRVTLTLTLSNLTRSRLDLQNIAPHGVVQSPKPIYNQ